MFVKDVLPPHREQLAKTWTEEWIDEVESDHRLLRKTYDEDEELRAVIDKHDVNTFSDEAWASRRAVNSNVCVRSAAVWRLCLQTRRRSYPIFPF